MLSLLSLVSPVNVDLICRTCGQANILILLNDLSNHELNHGIRSKVSVGDQRSAVEQAAAPRPAHITHAEGHTTKYL
jgi:hypothetical protein